MGRKLESLIIRSDRPGRPDAIGLAQRSYIQNASKNVAMTERMKISRRQNRGG